MNHFRLPYYRNYLLIAWLFIACNPVYSQNRLQHGSWRFVLQLNDSTELPFNAEVKGNTMDIINSDERISVEDIQYSGDSVFIRMPVFDSEFRGEVFKTE